MRVHARLSVRCNLLLGFLDILRLSVSLSLSVFLLTEVELRVSHVLHRHSTTQLYIPGIYCVVQVCQKLLTVLPLSLDLQNLKKQNNNNNKNIPKVGLAV